MTVDRKSRGMPAPTERERRPVPVAAPESLPPGLPPPGTLIAEKYEVERVLGAGGMGVVIAARHVHLGQRVAIKFMRGESAHDANAVGRFLREARAAVSLTSEHVARVLDVGTLDDGAPFMVMEYLAGIDLAQVLRRDGPLPIASAAGVVLQACEAIAEAHARGIVHRDLKPPNLFVTSRMDGSPLVKVLDFGISKALHGDAPQGPSLTLSGMVMGSPGYMSPEQVRSTKDVDARSDIWSLGVILYELLTAVSPFQGETLGDTFAKITSESPPPIRKLRPDVPEALAITIERCLERDLRTRIQTVGDLAAKLLPFAPSETAVAAARILRISAPAGGSTLTAPEGGGLAGTPAPAPWRTENSWLRSAANPGQSGRRRMAAVIAGGALLCATAGGYWTLTRVPSAMRQPQAVASPSALVPAQPPAPIEPPPPFQSAAPEAVILAPSASAPPTRAPSPLPGTHTTVQSAASTLHRAVRDAGRVGASPAPSPPVDRPGPTGTPAPSPSHSTPSGPDDKDLL
jgi:eukaryotic-like serine/threonine-protein kinase